MISVLMFTIGHNEPVALKVQEYVEEVVRVLSMGEGR